MDDKDKKDTNGAVICGARCVYQKDGKCRKNEKAAAAVIGIDGQCVRYEPADGRK